MITDDDLRSLLADREVPAGISPAAARRRARDLRLHRRVAATAGAAMLVPAVVAGAGLVRLPDLVGSSRHLPQAFGGDGRALPVGRGGVVTLDVPHLSAWADSESVCFGDWDGAAATVRSDLPAMCQVSGAVTGTEIAGGAIGSFSAVPVVRADFILGDETEHAQVTGFAQHPQWRVLTAPWKGPESDATNVVVRGWDADGKLVLSVGCVGGCPSPAQAEHPSVQPTVGVPAPAASSAPPTPGH